VELVRDLRSSKGYIAGEFKTFCLDANSPEFDAFWDAEGPYDYVLNLSALKHVRSERDPFTLMRMIRVNILTSTKLLMKSQQRGVRKYFCVSTDKAANPVNLMGASKLVMEQCIFSLSVGLFVSTARFANVAFSDGSLLAGFNERFLKRQPLSAPRDIKRYFVTPRESGLLCLFSCMLGGHREIFFPKLRETEHTAVFSEIASRYIRGKGYEPVLCSNEAEARARAPQLIETGKWPCLFLDSDTTGEKPFEEFYTDEEQLELDRFQDLGVITKSVASEPKNLEDFLINIEELTSRRTWSKDELVELFHGVINKFAYQDLDRYLDAKM
jgi:FlaA1/EpsC-like NDP-sugar epimerase